MYTDGIQRIITFSDSREFLGDHDETFKLRNTTSRQMSVIILS